MSSVSWGESEFAGTERFSVERRLGAGTTGVVYQAFDRERRTRVALKTLREGDADAIYYLKREFRSLAGVSHPNLVQLHELWHDAGRWFFTMELVEGVDFLSHVRAPGAEQTRLRSALRQLAEAVAALHATGKLHRDIKPSNALVTPEGRVVLLDFGLARELNPTQLLQTLEPRLVGTPAYLAPEQGAEGALGPACDWYSVGVMLYEALTGGLPFEGTLLEVLTAKQSRDPPPPRTQGDAIPDDLDRLCRELLRRRPEERPSGAEVLARLGQPRPAAPAASLTTTGPPGPWVGRGRQLARLAELFADTRTAGATPVFLHGGSGVGKTALAHRFLERLAGHDDVVVLAGRCYEHELVPYRALDGAVDGLTRYLLGLPPSELQALLPRDVTALSRLFPVVRRVEAITGPPRRPAADVDPQELRRRAFAAMRDLLGRLADRRGLVIFIDDLQWGDADSVALLEHLLAPADAPALMLLAAYRTEDRASSPCLQALLAAPAAGEGRPPIEEIEVEPLADDEARTLALALIGSDAPDASERAATIAREAAGSPFFVHELSTHAAGPLPVGARLTLDDVLRARIERLAVEPRRLLEALAVAGHPLDAEVAQRAAGIPPGELTPAAVLRASHLVRARGSGQALEVDHDRIRAAVTAQLTPEATRALHRRLAEALVAGGRVDPETLALHLAAAGEAAAAAEQAGMAAAAADEVLAFERAVRLYRWALELHAQGASGEPPGLRVRLGDALTNLGRGADAARAYLAAADGANAADSLELRRRAAEQLLRVGHLDDGLRALQSVLRAMDVDLAPTPRRALASLLLRRARLRLRGLGFVARDPSQIAPTDLTRLDVFWSAATALAIIDNIRAADFQARHLLLALSLGEPRRIARALAAEAGHSATGGGRTRRRTARLVRAAHEIAERLDQPFARGWATLAAGMGAYLEGRFREAHALCERAETTFHGCLGVWWEVGSARLFSLWSLFYLGESAEIGRRLPGYLKEAEERGDLFTATNLRSGVLNLHWLAAGDPARARREVDEPMERWSRDGFHSQHYWHMYADATISLYCGEPEAAWQRLERDWGAMSAALILRVQIGRIEVFGLRGRAALALAARRAGGERAALQASVERSIRRLEREQMPWATPLARMLLGGLRAQRGDRAGALEALADARAGFDAAEMALYAAVARRREGELRGGADGEALVRAADDWMGAQAIARPERVAALLAPGFSEGSAEPDEPGPRAAGRHRDERQTS